MKRWISFLMAIVMTYLLFAYMPSYARADAMTSSETLIEILKKREGFEKYPYKDNTQWSIGYGTRVPNGKLAYYQENGITQEEAEKLMRDMLKGFEKSILDFSAEYGFSLTQNQFDALVSFSYNCGDGWTKESSGNMNRAVREGWTGSDFVYAMCLWSRSGSQYILINRRLYEANMYINNIYESPYNHETGTFRYVFLESGQANVRYVIHGFDIRDPKPVRYDFKSVPTGKDADGNAFTYEFAGWYTAPENGKLVEVLDDTFESGSLIYALWKDPSGKLVYLPKGVECNITVTATKINVSMNVRSGPGTQYSKIGELKKNETVTLQRVYDDGSNMWGQFEGGWISLSYTNYFEVIQQQDKQAINGVVNANNVNVYSDLGTTDAIQYVLNSGDAVKIFEQTEFDGVLWGKLEDGNWISMTYVTLDSSEVPTEPPTEAPTQPPTEAPTQPPTEAPTQPPTEAPTQPPTEPKPAASADVNGSGSIDKDDAIYLLRHVVYPDKYPISVNCDVNGSGVIDKDDAIYLLRYVVYPEKYPLKLGE